MKVNSARMEIDPCFFFNNKKDKIIKIEMCIILCQSDFNGNLFISYTKYKYAIFKPFFYHHLKLLIIFILGKPISFCSGVNLFPFFYVIFLNKWFHSSRLSIWFIDYLLHNIWEWKVCLMFLLYYMSDHCTNYHV